MRLYNLTLLSSFSISLAVTIGLVRFRNINRAYHPFILICMAGLVNEFTSVVMMKAFGTNAVNANIYVFAEFLLFLWLFRRWGLLKKKKWHLPVLTALMFFIWVYDNLVMNRISTFNSLFRICYSFCLLFLSIEQVNKLIAGEKGSLLRNSLFLICSGVLIFYSYKATIEVFYLLKLPFTDAFYNNVYYILILVNLFVNLIYALAVLWIPKKQRFILRF